MKTLSFNPSSEEQHACIGHKEGDWIIFTCPQCKGYERRINWKTGEMKSRVGDNPVLHTGFHAPVEIVEQSNN